MTQEEIIKGNKLITKFLKCEFVKEKGNGDDYKPSYWIGESMWFEGRKMIYTDLLFHKNWDWLVHVLRKIKNLTCLEETAFHKSNDLWDSVLGFEIEAVWRETVKFIRWYLKQTA